MKLAVAQSREVPTDDKLVHGTEMTLKDLSLRNRLTFSVLQSIKLRVELITRSFGTCPEFTGWR